jgi:hypothetical protein
MAGISPADEKLFSGEKEIVLAGFAKLSAITGSTSVGLALKLSPIPPPVLSMPPKENPGAVFIPSSIEAGPDAGRKPDDSSSLPSW